MNTSFFFFKKVRDENGSEINLIQASVGNEFPIVQF